MIALGALILLAVAFSGGVAVGERKARHFAGWAENYGRMFDGPLRSPPRGMPMFNAPMLPGGYGVFGKVVSVSGQTVVVQGQDRVEQNVLITSSTEIRVGRDTGTVSDIRPDVDAAVFGAPNDQGQIEARLIRLMNATGTR